MLKIDIYATCGLYFQKFMLKITSDKKLIKKKSSIVYFSFSEVLWLERNTQALSEYLYDIRWLRRL